MPYFKEKRGIAVRKWEDSQRQVWSCRLWELPEEDETAQLEEELKGRKLHFAEDALTLQRYIRSAGCSQEEAARRLGRSQSSVANRLRLLKLPVDVLQRLREESLTERHGRCLLRLTTPELQRQALDTFCREKMSVAAAESYVDVLTSGKGSIRCAAVTDLSMLFPSLNRDLESLRRCGLHAEFEQQESEDHRLLIIRIPKGNNREKTFEKT